VSPAGDVDSVTVDAAPDTVVAACVAEAVQKATFAATRNGGSFRYPFMLGPSP
jgi:hypothetical protein